MPLILLVFVANRQREKQPEVCGWKIVNLNRYLETLTGNPFIPIGMPNDRFTDSGYPGLRFALYN